MTSPDWEPIEAENLNTNRIVPIYPLTANVTQKWLRKLMHQVVTYWAPKLTDHLPETIRRAAGLPDLGTAILQAHFPDSDEKLQAARQRLAFDEIFFCKPASCASGGTGKKSRGASSKCRMPGWIPVSPPCPSP